MKLDKFSLMQAAGLEPSVDVLNEGTFEGNAIAVYDGENGMTQIYKKGSGYYGVNDDFDFHFETKAELEMMLKKWRYKLIAGALKEDALDESNNRWWNTLVSLGKIRVSVQWLDKLSYQPPALKGFIEQHFKGVNPSDLVIVFKRDAGVNWDKAKALLGTGVVGSDSSYGEFIVVNSLTA